MKGTLILCCMTCALCMSCATTGNIAPQIVTESVAVDASISQLQTQQATSAATVEQVTATVEQVATAVTTGKTDKLPEQVATLKTQISSLSASLKTERDKTAQIQTDYSALKVTAGTQLSDQSSKILTQQQKIRTRNKCILILAIILFVHLICDAAVVLLKFYFHKI